MKIFSESGIYAGWPANHGKWQWDNEILIGFVSGQYDPSNFGCHNVDGELFFKQARSLDYGKTWSIEDTGIPEEFFDYQCVHFPGGTEETIYRVRGNYDHGGDFINSNAGFWYSNDRGKTWLGPCLFNGLDFSEKYQNSSRSMKVGDVHYLTQKKQYEWGSDEVIPCDYDGNKFNIIENKRLSLGYRTVMPSVIDCPLGLIMAVRTKFKAPNKDGIEVYKYENGWQLVHETDTGDNNGNPPSLLYRNGKVYLFFGNRAKKQMRRETTEDLKNWWPEVIHTSKTNDFGYPQSFDAGEGGIGVAFYEDNGQDRSEIKCVFVKDNT